MGLVDLWVMGCIKSTVYGRPNLTLLSMHFGQVLHGWTGGLGLIQGYCSINFWHHTSAYDFVSRFYYTLTPPLSMSGLGMFLVNLLRSGPWGFFILFRSICPCLRLLTWLPATVYPTYYWLYYAPLKMHSLWCDNDMELLFFASEIDSITLFLM